MAIHYLRIKNRSDHSQTFQCHGYNGDKNLTVKANSEAKLEARDGTSGAIIAVHEGQIGEQCEITKCGWQGNDTIDISNICGAGGNLTCQQVGDPAGKFKGHETFMQACNNAYKKLPQAKKDKLKGWVFLDSKGNVKRIGAPKSHRPLEEFVRTFANGRTYIGVGAWGPSAGHPDDNKQSSAGKGSKDILIVYSDGNAAPDPKKPFTGQSVSIKTFGIASVEGGEDGETGDAVAEDVVDDSEVVEESADKEATESSTEGVEVPAATEDAEVPTINEPTEAPVVSEPTEADDSTTIEEEENTGFSVMSAAAPLKPGIKLTNKSSKKHTYYFFDNYWNGNGTGGANFDKPLKSVELKPNETKHVPLPLTFKGRVQRGKDQPATWGEFQIKASNDAKSHGDISLQQGCDGAATVASTDGTNVSNGFTKDIVKGAPAKALTKKPNGEKVLATTEGNWTGPGNQAAIDWEVKQLGWSKAYIKGGSGVPDIASKNNCLHFTFYVVV